MNQDRLFKRIKFMLKRNNTYLALFLVFDV